MVSYGEKSKRTKNKVVASTKQAKQRIAPRTKQLPLNDRRMTPEELNAEMLKMSQNFVRNVEFLLDKLEMSWKELSHEAGLGASTVYQVKNFKANAGTATAAQYGKVLGVEPWTLFEPHARFKVLFARRSTGDAERN